jgi:hypothetical protein
MKDSAFPLKQERSFRIISPGIFNILKIHSICGLSGVNLYFVEHNRNFPFAIHSYIFTNDCI